MAVPMAVALYMADSVAVVIFQQPDHIAEVWIPLILCSLRLPYQFSFLSAATLMFKDSPADSICLVLLV